MAVWASADVSLTEKVPRVWCPGDLTRLVSACRGHHGTPVPHYTSTDAKSGWFLISCIPYIALRKQHDIGMVGLAVLVTHFAPKRVTAGRPISTQNEHKSVSM